MGCNCTLRYWYWVVICAAFIHYIIISGLLHCFNYYFPLFLNEFGESHSITASVGSVHYSNIFLPGPLVSLVIQRHGFHVGAQIGGFLIFLGYSLSYFAANIYHLFFTYGLLAGVGNCFMYTSFLSGLHVSVPHQHRVFFMSLALTGNGLGFFVIAYPVQLLLHMFGWRVTFLVNGGLGVFCSLLAAALFPYQKNTVNMLQKQDQLTLSKRYSLRNQSSRNSDVFRMAHCPSDDSLNNIMLREIVHNPDKKNSVSKKVYTHTDNRPFLTYCEIISSPRFWLVVAAIICFLGGAVITLTFTKKYSESLGLADKFIYAYAALGGLNAIGRVMPGVMSGKFPVAMQFALSGFVSAAAVVGLIYVKEFYQMAVVLGIFGFAYGYQCSLTSVAPDEMFGKVNQTRIVGLNFLFAGIGFLIGAPAGGHVMDYFDDFLPTFLLAAGLNVIGSLLAISTYFIPP